MKKAYILVVLQFSMLFAIAYYCGVWGAWWQNAVTMAALGLGVWAVAAMRFSVNILPTVRQKQQLFTSGPYKYIRHPMYTAILLATSMWVLNRVDAVAVALWLALLIVLVVKLHYEETLLTKHFSGYKQYTKTTKRLIPFVY